MAVRAALSTPRFEIFGNQALRILGEAGIAAPPNRSAAEMARIDIQEVPQRRRENGTSARSNSSLAKSLIDPQGRLSSNMQNCAVGASLAPMVRRPELLELERGADIYRLAVTTVVLQRSEAVVFDIVANAARHCDSMRQRVRAPHVKRVGVALAKAGKRMPVGLVGAHRNPAGEAAQRIAYADDGGLATTSAGSALLTLDTSPATAKRRHPTATPKL